MTTSENTLSRVRTSVGSYGVSLDLIKDYLKVENTNSDALLSGFITASYEYITERQNRDYSEATYSANISSGSAVYITTQYVNSVSTGSLRNELDGAYVDFDTPFSGEFTYTVASGSSVPAKVMTVQHLLVALWYENPDADLAKALDFTINNILGVGYFRA